MNIVLFHPHELAQPLLRDDPRSRHIRRILKSKEGDVLRVGLINGLRGTARIMKLTPEEIHLEFNLHIPTIPLNPVRLLCGLPRPQQAKRILRDCSSMGVSHIWFIPTELGELSYRHSPIWQNEAWLGFVQEGVEQSGGTLFPDVKIFDDLETCFAELPDRVIRCLFDTLPSEPIASLSRRWMKADRNNLLSELPENYEIALAIGSERGWTDAERHLLLNQYHCNRLSLGNHVLRTDTACIAATALALARFLV